MRQASAMMSASMHMMAVRVQSSAKHPVAPAIWPAIQSSTEAIKVARTCNVECREARVDLKRLRQRSYAP
eukprot:3738284-Pleurochrysis_carterae.AAC.3